MRSNRLGVIVTHLSHQRFNMPRSGYGVVRVKEHVKGGVVGELCCCLRQ